MKICPKCRVPLVKDGIYFHLSLIERIKDFFNIGQRGFEMYQGLKCRNCGILYKGDCKVTRKEVEAEVVETEAKERCRSCYFDAYGCCLEKKCHRDGYGCDEWIENNTETIRLFGRVW